MVVHLMRRVLFLLRLITKKMDGHRLVGLVLLFSLLPVYNIVPDGTALFVRGNPDIPGQDFAYTSELWVDAVYGDDLNDGKAQDRAKRTIQAAANIATPGTKVRILPGIYRESIIPGMSGDSSAPILYTAEAGPGTVFVRGSEPVSDLSWTMLTANNIGLPPGIDPANIFYTDLASWGLVEAPHFVVELDQNELINTRLTPAREPDWQVATPWKYSEYWWAANGGSTVAGCDPRTDPNTNCDLAWRSFTQLTDTASDQDIAGIENGNLTTLGNLTGATLMALDAKHAHYFYRRKVTAHDISLGRITVDKNSDNDGTPGLGWGSKYYLENHPALLDRPGEWWYDINSGRLYLWAPAGGDPGNYKIEISRRLNGFDLANRSYILLNGINIELFNGAAYTIVNKNRGYKSFGNGISNVSMQYADNGVVLNQYINDNASSTDAIDGFTLEYSTIAHIDTAGFYSYFGWRGAPSPTNYTYAAIRNTIIRNNEMYDLGFYSDEENAVGIWIFFPNQLRFENNHVHDVAQNGVHFHLSVIVSTKEYGFLPSEIKTGNVLVKDNLIERSCQLSSDCGGLKFGGGNRPSTHVFRDVLVVGNTFRNILGWSYASVQRKLNVAGDGNGMYVDYASGIHMYRNISYKNSGAGFKFTCLWRDGDLILYNNVIADNFIYGIKMTDSTSTCDKHNGSVNTQVVNNIYVNNGGYGLWIESNYSTNNFGNLLINNNLYHINGWNAAQVWGLPAIIKLMQYSLPPQYLHDLKDVHASTPWEAQGVEGDPVFQSYDPNDRDLAGANQPDFHLLINSVNAYNRGKENLPVSLSTLLANNSINDFRFGPAYDIGAFELTVNGPMVTSISRLDSNPTVANIVSFAVNFSEAVTGVDLADFNLVATNITGASISSVSGSGAARTVTVNTGSGSGFLRLDVIDNDSIIAADSKPLGGVGLGNGNFINGAIYSVRLIDSTGVFRPTNGAIYLKKINVSGFADAQLNYGVGGDYPIMGDWNGDGVVTLGIYRNGAFYLRNSNSIGFADLMVVYGAPGDQPVAGDWNNDGIDTIGIYRDGSFMLRNSNTSGAPEMIFSLGVPGDIGIAGDWNGDGYDSTGVFRPSNGALYLKNLNTTGYADIAINYGLAGDHPIVGDWDGDGIDTIGIYRAGTFFLRNSNTIGYADFTFGLGVAGDMPISGKWGLP